MQDPRVCIRLWRGGRQRAQNHPFLESVKHLGATGKKRRSSLARPFAFDRDAMLDE